MNNPVHSAWFDGRYKVINERDILFCNSGKARPDRVMDLMGKKPLLWIINSVRKKRNRISGRLVFIVKHYDRWAIPMWQVIFGMFPWEK